MSYKTSQIIGIYYTQIGTHKSAKKSNFCVIRFCRTLSMSSKNACPQQKCIKPFVAICFGFNEKNISLAGLYFYLQTINLSRETIETNLNVK